MASSYDELHKRSRIDPIQELHPGKSTKVCNFSIIKKIGLFYAYWVILQQPVYCVNPIYRHNFLICSLSVSKFYLINLLDIWGTPLFRIERHNIRKLFFHDWVDFRILYQYRIESLWNLAVPVSQTDALFHYKKVRKLMKMIIFKKINSFLTWGVVCDIIRKVWGTY